MLFRSYQSPEQLIAWNKANLEAAARLAGIALDGAERLLDIQMKATKSAFADGVQQAKALAGAMQRFDFDGAQAALRGLADSPRKNETP